MAKDIIFPEALQLRQNNPYSIGNVFVFKEGDFVLDRERLPYVKSPNDRYYTVRDKDTLGAIAFDYYGSSKWWWVLADVNEIDFGFRLETGKTLIIPDFSIIQLSL